MTEKSIPVTKMVTITPEVGTKNYKCRQNYLLRHKNEMNFRLIVNGKSTEVGKPRGLFMHDFNIGMYRINKNKNINVL